MDRVAPYSVFHGHCHLLSASLEEVALAVKRVTEGGALEPILVFNNTTGRTIDINVRGTDVDIVARLRPPPPNNPDIDRLDGTSPPQEARGRGRPRLGVVAREVTLLPRHWDWLAEQAGGASVTLRRLVEDARRNDGKQNSRRPAQERAYHFMSAIAGDLPGFEESTRALFADDRARFDDLTAHWPADIRGHAAALGFASPHESA